MKLGVVFIAIGIINFIALIILGTMALIMGDYVSAILMTLYTSIAGGIFLFSGIKRMKKAKEINWEGKG